MDIPPSLAADLARLADGGDGVTTGLDQLVGDLADAVARAVESFLGLRATVSSGTDSFSAVLLDPRTTQAQVRASVRIPLGAGGSVVLLAGVAGALVDLAADLAHALGTAPELVVLDDDLVLPDAAAAHRALDELSVVNQAVGVLVTRGWTVEGAHAELVDRSTRAGTGPAGAARVVLASLRRGGGRGPPAWPGRSADLSWS